MSKHKKQHFIPSCYLKAWCDPECPPEQTPYIWVFEKESKIGKRKAPDNVFHEKDMYTIRDESGGRDLTIEHGLSQLEGMFAKIRKKKLHLQRALSDDDHFKICVFIAAMHARTRSQLDHVSNQWSAPLKMADDLAESMKTATREEKLAMSQISSASISSKGASFTHEKVREIVEDPVGTMLLPMINVTAPLYSKLDFAVLTTDHKLGFITTDSPCVFHDPEGYKRPPMYRGPALMYDTIEISLPISPTHCILLNRKGFKGYIKVEDIVVNEFNRRHRFYASKAFIVNQNDVEDLWFDRGVEPEDSWEKEQGKKS